MGDQGGGSDEPRAEPRWASFDTFDADMVGILGTMRWVGAAFTVWGVFGRDEIVAPPTSMEETDGIASLVLEGVWAASPSFASTWCDSRRSRRHCSNHLPVVLDICGSVAIVGLPGGPTG